MRLLVVEDEKSLRDDITKKLRLDGYEADACGDGNEARELLAVERYDLVLLDINLPGADGMTILREFRTVNYETPVLILSARSEITDKVEGLDAGANDYLTKPFSVEELLARLRVTARRLAMMQANNANESVFRNGKLRVDYAAGSAYMDEEELHLTPIEYKLLCLLSQNVPISQKYRKSSDTYLYYTKNLGQELG